jgi:hypothetical protein
MLDHDTKNRSAETRRPRQLNPDEVGYPGWGRFGSVLVGRGDRLRLRRLAPAYQV